MSLSENFCLRWNDFESNISLAFREIRKEKDFFDCTLSCGAKQIQAHKLILSACSPFFRSILRQNPHQHPLLYLKGVEFNNLQSVLNFMYHGEVSVAQEELNSFLAVAEDLHVKGLTQDKSSEGKSGLKTKSESVTSSAAPRLNPQKQDAPAPKHCRQAPTYSTVQTYENNIQEVMPVVKQETPIMMQEPLASSQPLDSLRETYQPVNIMEENYVDDEYDMGYGDYEGIERYEKGMGNDSTAEGDQNEGFFAEDFIQSIDNVDFKCKVCGRSFVQKSDCKRHILNKHSNVKQQAACSFCGKTFKNKQSLGNHTRLVHSMYRNGAKSYN